MRLVPWGGTRIARQIRDFVPIAVAESNGANDTSWLSRMVLAWSLPDNASDLHCRVLALQ